MVVLSLLAYNNAIIDPPPLDYDFDGASLVHEHGGLGGEHDLDGGLSRLSHGFCLHPGHVHRLYLHDHGRGWPHQNQNPRVGGFDYLP